MSNYTCLGLLYTSLDLLQNLSPTHEGQAEALFVGNEFK